MVVFFFQAEDGIRDVAVTGVQTCALPILALALSSPLFPGDLSSDGYTFADLRADLAGRLTVPPSRRLGLGMGLRGRRSEERRVGKECRARRAAEHYKNSVGVVSAQENVEA